MQVYLATFASTHAAMAFEGSFGGEGALVPVPPALRAGCGMAWRFVASDDEAAHSHAAAVAAAAGLTADGWQLHARADAGYRSVPERAAQPPEAAS